MTNNLSVIPVKAPVKQTSFDLYQTIETAIHDTGNTLQEGDVLAVSSKYVAISENSIVDLEDVYPTPQAEEFAARYNMDARMAQLVIEEADHIFGGIPMGYLLTWKHGVIAPNAGLDRSNIPSGKVVLLPKKPYIAAADIRRVMQNRFGVDIGVILTDSWLMPGRYGTTGVAIGTAGLAPIQDERGKDDLFGNPMAVTQRGIADSLCVCAQMVMGERDEATPIAIVRNSGVELTSAAVDQNDISIPWEMCIYVESLTLGLLPDGAPRESFTERLSKRDKAEF